MVRGEEGGGEKVLATGLEGTCSASGEYLQRVSGIPTVCLRGPEACFRWSPQRASGSPMCCASPLDVFPMGAHNKLLLMFVMNFLLRFPADNTKSLWGIHNKVPRGSLGKVTLES